MQKQCLVDISLTFTFTEDFFICLKHGLLNRFWIFITHSIISVWLHAIYKLNTSSVVGNYNSGKLRFRYVLICLASYLKSTSKYLFISRVWEEVALWEILYFGPRGYSREFDGHSSVTSQIINAWWLNVIPLEKVLEHTEQMGNIGKYILWKRHGVNCRGIFFMQNCA